MELRVMLPALFICAFFLGAAASVKTENVFYVLGSDGIYVIDPEAKRLVAKITNMTSPGLCNRTPCSFSQAAVVNNDTVFVADVSGSTVHVIDVKTQKKNETIPTDPYPYGLYSLPWRKEVWVHSWNLSTFDVIETESHNRTYTAIRAHVKPGFSHGIMLAQKDMLNGKTAYVTHFSNSGIHQLSLENKTYTDFIDFPYGGCTGTYGIAYSSYNKHFYVECRKQNQSVSIIEFKAVRSLQIVWNFPGFPFVSPNGRYVVVLYRYKNISRMNILAVTGSKSERYPELRIPGGVSHAVFYPKSKTSHSYNVFITLDYSNKMAVVDLDLAKNGSISDVKYIEDVGLLDTKPHGASRELFISGKWIVSPATESKTVVIINAETQKVHGKVSGVNGGDFAVWVGGSTTGSPTGGTSTGTTSTGGTPTSRTPTSRTPAGGTSGIASPRNLVALLIFLFGVLM